MIPDPRDVRTSRRLGGATIISSPTVFFKRQVLLRNVSPELLFSCPPGSVGKSLWISSLFIVGDHQCGPGSLYGKVKYKNFLIRVAILAIAGSAPPTSSTAASSTSRCLRVTPPSVWASAATCGSSESKLVDRSMTASSPHFTRALASSFPSQTRPRLVTSRLVTTSERLPPSSTCSHSAPAAITSNCAHTIT